LLADAQESIERAKSSPWGTGLECGPLCADVRQFPLNPSSMLLRNQTAFLIIRGAEFKLLPILDKTTLAIAEGYTLGLGTDASKQKFAQAALLLQSYISKRAASVAVRKHEAGDARSSLSDQATTLRNLVLAQSQ
jgi:hypothetical protein